jgi:hypothetical protein
MAKPFVISETPALVMSAGAPSILSLDSALGHQIVGSFLLDD